jgi:hypothetical protein
MAINILMSTLIVIGCVCSIYFILSCTIDAITSREPGQTVCGMITIVMLSIAAAKIFGG